MTEPRDWLWLLLLAAMWGGSFLFMRVAVPALGPFPLIALRLGVATLALLPLALWTWPPQAPTATVWGAVLLLALACTAFAYVIFYRLIEKLGATRASSVTYLVPVFGVLWGALWLGEVVSVAMLAGGVLILAGVLLLGWQRRG